MKKKKTVILDSSVWVSYVLNCDVNHLKACEIMVCIKNDIILLPEIILLETIINVYKINKSIIEAKEVMRFLLAKRMTLVTLELEVKVDLILKYLVSISLKASDFQVLLYTIHYNPDKFYSFDKKLKREYSKLATDN